MSKFNKVTTVMAEHIFRTGIEAGLLEDDVRDFATANVFAAAALEGFWKFLSLADPSDPDGQETRHTQDGHRTW